MSKTTNVILACSSGENEIAILDKLSKFNYQNCNFNIVSIEDKKLPKGWYGGNKNFECNLFLGAYNNFDLERFVAFLQTIEWEDCDSVQLIFKEQHGSFRIIDVFTSRSPSSP